MAEGGYDPETTNPFDTHRDDHDNDNIPLLPRAPDHKIPDISNPPGWKPPVTKTSTSQQHETSFIDNASSARVHTNNRELERLRRD